MAGIYSLLGVDDGDRSFISRIGADRVYDAAATYLQMVDAEMRAAYSVFIQGEVTEMYAERYKLPGGGRMQKRGMFASNAATRPAGGWDVAYPLDDFEEPVAENDVEVAYMTLPDVQNSLDNIQLRNINAMRYEILWRLFNNANRTFVDQVLSTPTLTVKPLANGDSDLYPPVIGSEAEATENHYLESNYAAGSISNTNNPFPVIRRELEEHFGTPTGYGNIAVFINSAQTSVVEALADYDPVTDQALTFGANRDTVTGALPMGPGRVLGRANGAWVMEWDWIPAGYALGLDLEAPAPLKMRVDTAESGLTRGLHLKAESSKHPLYARHWRNRYGIGVGNRLNGVVMEFGTGGTYTVPTAYQ